MPCVLLRSAWRRKVEPEGGKFNLSEQQNKALKILVGGQAFDSTSPKWISPRETY